MWSLYGFQLQVLYISLFFFEKPKKDAEIVKNQESSVQNIAQSLADYLREYMQRVLFKKISLKNCFFVEKIINDLLFIQNYTAKVLTKDPYYYNPNKTLQAFNYLLTKDPNITNPYFALHPLENLGFFSWYLDDDTIFPSNITSEITLENLKIATNSEIVIRPVYRNAQRIQLAEGRSGYYSIYQIYDEDELFYLYPCPSSSAPFDSAYLGMNSTCLKEKNKTFSMTCEVVYLDTKQIAVDYGVLLNMNNPILTSYSPVNTSVWDSTVKFAVKGCVANMDSQNPKKLKLITCIEADITDMKEHFKNASRNSFSSFYFLGDSSKKIIGSIIFSQNYTISAYVNDTRSLVELEFGV